VVHVRDFLEACARKGTPAVPVENEKYMNIESLSKDIEVIHPNENTHDFGSDAREVCYITAKGGLGYAVDDDESPQRRQTCACAR
jgi:hypothetical protein